MGRLRASYSGPILMDPRGFTLVRLLLGLVVACLLVGVAQPWIRASALERKAQEVGERLREVRSGVQAYHDSRGDWPVEEPPGRPPPGLDEYLPEGLSFTTPEYQVDYENRMGSGIFDIGLSLIMEDERLGSAILDSLGERVYRAGNRYTWVIQP